MGLADIDFVDMYLGMDFCELRGVGGTSGGIIRAPAEVHADLDAIRELCRERQELLGGIAEFSVKYGHRKFRVTGLTDVTDNDVWILSESGFTVRPLEDLKLPQQVVRYVTRKDLRGLFIVFGPMNAGKTNTVSSIIKGRLELHGGIGLTVEDPPEGELHGQHGDGYCIQVRVSRQQGGYHEQMMRTLRSRADHFLVGEVRDPASTLEMLRLAATVGPIFVTTHGETLEQGLAGLVARCRGIDTSADALNALLADALSGAMWQKLDLLALPGGGHTRRLRTKTLLMGGPDEQIIKTKIRAGNFSQLSQEIDNQLNHESWSAKK